MTKAISANVTGIAEIAKARTQASEPDNPLSGATEIPARRARKTVRDEADRMAAINPLEGASLIER
ncbi:hypothetical protein D3870_20905 [Noviherbaspirillum cavernae]|uniref:Uncharacterized protein n=1 Tax=Noviherbaspirillum cavernae TaxID=2320862 RepID=A0A418WVW5_9BURK|nr:hypothetical protein [Noviherbaspirillum cavernae]RJF96845.1 hypothetical protein D3870_20905 [Noviherbaspirillum cavernae]